ncbi:MAG: N-acetyltransferase [Planctomycetota bacterium]|nr:MAG: N-acetyltransferase [Planctomycetota bacterium]
MTSPRLRLAIPEDAEALRAIYAPVVRDTAISFEYEVPERVEIARRVQATLTRAPWLVACDASGRVLGYAYGGRYRERVAYDWLVETSVYIAAEARGRGVGRQLYVALLAALTQQGHRRAIAGVTLPNEASVAFHTSFGFEACGVVQRAGWKHGAWHDVGFYERALSDELGAPEPLRSTDDLFADPDFQALLDTPS